LLEVVTEPDLRSAAEAIEAFKRLRQLVVYLGISDGNMQEGSIRADVNVSVRKIGDKALGTRTETKNLNSFRFLGQAINFEVRRQIIEIESGKAIIQETRLWDAHLKESRSMRGKEEAHDYRYFPDPDLPPLRIAAAQIKEIKDKVSELPVAKLRRYQAEYGLNESDANVLTDDIKASNYFESALRSHNNPKSIANFVINELFKNLESNNEEGVGLATSVPPDELAKVVKMIDDAQISSSIGKKVLALLQENPQKTASRIVQENSWVMINDEKAIIALVDRVIRDNPEEVAKYRSGKTNVFGFLMGQLMKQSKGKANPDLANRSMSEALNKK
jgi:aspartyl-tRNA(Asn)/glutamyl-tRNA(Gln) amidotransferase subunit B